MIINEGFSGNKPKDSRLPPGQYMVRDFPVLSLGPTPEIYEDKWKLEVTGLVERPLVFNILELKDSAKEEVKRDIHCVTKWSKFDTNWTGVSMDELIQRAGVKEEATHLIAHSYDGYTTNLPIKDISGGKAWVVFLYEGEAIDPEHGGPVRLLVPHLYFWKSAKWLKKLEFVDGDVPGFWEVRGYHNYGDPWKEQRYDF
ncbi:MAG: sulfite oxidase-like oxidoreductase, partial [Patescibacteria group bacterium]